MDIGNKIRELRIKNGYTQEELAAMLNVTPQAVSRWECGVSLPDITMLPLLTKHLFVSADELLGCDLKTNELFDSCDSLDVSGEVLTQDKIDSVFADRDIISDGTPKRVLIVDDAEFIRNVIRDVLTKEGHSVLVAGDAHCADIVLEHAEVDIIILDINMPKMNGLDYLKNKPATNTKIIMLSLLSCESIVREAYNLGACAFIAKPFAMDSIIKRI